MGGRGGDDGRTGDRGDGASDRDPDGHAHLRVEVVQRTLLRDGESVLVLRTERDGWELPDGRVERDESAAESLAREVREETGLVVESADPVATAVYETRESGKDHGLFGVVYDCEWRGEAVRLGDEHRVFRWVEAKGLDATAFERAAEATAVADALGER